MNRFSALAVFVALAGLSGCGSQYADSDQTTEGDVVVYTRPNTSIRIEIRPAQGTMGTINSGGNFTKDELKVLITVLDSIPQIELTRSGLKHITPVVAAPSVIPPGGYSLTHDGVIIYLTAQASDRVFNPQTAGRLGDTVFAGIKAFIAQAGASLSQSTDPLTPNASESDITIEPTTVTDPIKGRRYVGSNSPSSYRPIADSVMSRRSLNRLGHESSDVHPVETVVEPPSRSAK